MYHLMIKTWKILLVIISVLVSWILTYIFSLEDKEKITLLSYEWYDNYIIYWSLFVLIIILMSLNLELAPSDKSRMMSFTAAHGTRPRVACAPQYAADGAWTHKSSDRTAAGCCWVAAMCGVRLSGAFGYANTDRRLWMCKLGSCTIAHALRLCEGEGELPGRVK